MTLVREIEKDDATCVGLEVGPEGRTAIHRSGGAAVIWRREPSPDFQYWIDALEPEQ